MQLLVGLTASEADSRPVAVTWTSNLERVPETELMQQKGFVLQLCTVQFQKWVNAGVKMWLLCQKQLMTCLRET